MPPTNPAPKTHHNCLTKTYCRDDKQDRFMVPVDKIPWKVPYPEYAPADFTMPHILKKPAYADPNIRIEDIDLRFNQLDGKIDRRSHHGKYELDDEGSPLNPVGRTGLRGRGTLGRWGPNHAADPVVTRWKRDTNKKVVEDPVTKKPILQFVAISRRDHGDWAIPGGMVDAGEQVNVTLRREFGEEALSSLEVNDNEKQDMQKILDEVFKNGEEIYRGYVDDPRNTDNAWMETQVFNFHDEKGKHVGLFRLHAGDDAHGVKWMDIRKDLKLFANHIDFLKEVAIKRKAHY